MKNSSLIDRIVAEYSALHRVEAVALAGSQTAGLCDEASDIDLYVYLNADLTLQNQKSIAETFAEHPEVGNSFWETRR